MTHFRHIATAALTMTVLGTSIAFAQTKPSTEKKIYCWNEGGRKVCGDALPASAANSARTEISTRSGMTTGRVDRALTGSERSAADQAAELARKQAEALALQQRRDLAMVESYMTEADLRRAYGERTALLDETLKASKLGLSNLRLSLLALLRQAGDQELAGPVTKGLTTSIREQHGELLRQQQILITQQQDRGMLEDDLQDSLRRYRELKRDEAPAATAPAAPAAG
ncbi:hypothetical protein [Thermomonas carbonis]|jgi:hypothetical protein|uniref:DUF4124 domain-containing protein n=1 Tax=Thermomonas carbonis TaxID=1463158 RepID=A0A7G9SSE2_9GAMM|nr:hypothetical protein [Thermomonas carbonis]QNN70767.1 hypothetical protein H9L16_03980 [Thermomonas carbonis]GHC02224.1 hypothetical protein GCM10010080_15020 [Thermomonas carbonis]